MSKLQVYTQDGSAAGEVVREHGAIAAQLAPLGVSFERWEADRALQLPATQDSILAAYDSQVRRLMQDNGFNSVDVVSLGPDHPDRETLRAKFLAEHTHADFEVRFFVGGSGLFYLHVGDTVYLVLCEQGDLISVPAGVTHWFDMGAQPDFTCIRLFTTADGWVGAFTDSGISDCFPSYDDFVARAA